MRRLLITFSLLLALFAPTLAFAGSAGAVNIAPNCGVGSANGTPDVCQPAETPPANNPVIRIIKAAIIILSYVVGVAAIIGIIVASLRLMTANGDAAAVAKARSGIIYSLIGIVVAVLAQAIVYFVITNIG